METFVKSIKFPMIHTFLVVKPYECKCHVATYTRIMTLVIFRHQTFQYGVDLESSPGLVTS